MKQLARWWSVQRIAYLGILAFLMLGVESPAQEKDNKPPKEAKEPEGRWKLRSMVRSGYTRPGFPEDKLNKDGKVRPAALDPDEKDKLIGGTVYFVVLERTGAEGDTWGSGMSGFNEKFVEGKNFKNNFSPALDTQAKYLYLYQVVNDRGLEPPPENIKLAADQEIKSVPIAGAALQIIVDPRYITSWGHFHGAGFVAKVPDRNRKGDIRLAADKAPAEIRLAVSSNPSILAELPYKRYLDPSPAYPLKNLKDSFGVGSDTLNLKDSSAFADLAKRKAVKGVVLAAYEENIILAAANAKDPDYVQLLYHGFEDGTAAIAPTLEGNSPVAIFRADWRDNALMKLGFHSTVYGFTSDLPPTDERIRIEDPTTALRGWGMVGNAQAQGAKNQDALFAAAQDLEGEQFVQAPAPAPGQAPAPGTGITPAVGTVPTPTPPVGGGTPVAGGATGSMGGAPAGFGGGGGMPGLGGGGLGVARPPIFGGGGGGLGTGSGNGNGTPTQNQVQTPSQQGSQIVNFNATLINQQVQAQAQRQSQRQSQHQHQNQNNNHGNGVVPEPGTIILALLGLPGLFFLGRRKQTAVPATA